ncbi:MAG: hypothetical protein MK207_14860 [Saprospiraceae bacterium]|uniref:hypothetical protein n=1 Tax=Kordia sp. TaxID=1965332 RepID=UPI0025BA9B96|nr:hypothetical protein [Kordia sp.]MCH2023754.1 hypothetical protein [Saprospiraceae bacterium]MCH2196542.1 hypothetical protein [Kordia sp.]
MNLHFNPETIEDVENAKYLLEEMYDNIDNLLITDLLPNIEEIDREELKEATEQK